MQADFYSSTGSVIAVKKGSVADTGADISCSPANMFSKKFLEHNLIPCSTKLFNANNKEIRVIGKVKLQLRFNGRKAWIFSLVCPDLRLSKPTPTKSEGKNFFSRIFWEFLGIYIRISTPRIVIDCRNVTTGTQGTV